MSPIVLKTEGLKFIQKNFQDEGFNDGGLQKVATPKKLLTHVGETLPATEPIG